jgi:predicted Rossmann fold nucleotide-binding protein DprA/Smf involved in DNA uptake
MIHKRIGIVGSRRWKNREMVEVLVHMLPGDVTIVTGGCDGVDTWAAETARQRRLVVVEHLPDLPPDGSPRWKFTKAYHTRNRLIAEDVDVLFAFVAKDRRGGTENTIQYAMKLNVQVEVIFERSRSPSSTDESDVVFEDVMLIDDGD